MIMDLVEIEPVQLSFDYSEYSFELAASLERHAANMEGFTKRYAADMGKELAEAKAEIHAEKQTGWEKWVEGRLGITKQWADKIIKQYVGEKSETNFPIPVEQPVEPDEEVKAVGNFPTNEEKRKTVLDFIADTPHWQEMSNRAIARICGVDHKTVAAIRKELYPDPEPIALEPELEPVIEPVLVEVELVPEPVIESTIEQIEPEPEPEVSTVVDPEPMIAPNPVVEEEKSETPVKSPILTALQSSESNEWYTPLKYINAARELMGGIDLDPASCEQANRFIKAADFYHISRNGLEESWKGRVWLNPPYGLTDGESNQAIWSQYLIKQIEEGNTKEAVLLVNANTEAKWFQPLYKYLICFTDHRIHFYNLDGEANQPTQGNALVYFGSKRELFIELFSRFGIVMERAK